MVRKLPPVAPNVERSIAEMLDTPCPQCGARHGDHIFVDASGGKGTALGLQCPTDEETKTEGVR